ncbi:hypothetical protein AURDEDRAFT_164317 [Auricularia subglabra TFB-10046 SS5]|nr:hypothetical protein AURDEDRAFT_164317 [Auricularia subglabra TFB-10046 SS5]
MSCATIVLLSILAVGWSRLVNITIDDSFGDAWTSHYVSYNDVPPFNNRSEIQWTESIKNLSFPYLPRLPALDWGQLQNGTVHFTTTLAEKLDSGAWLSFDFEGSAIYVFFVLNSAAPTNVTWLLDDGVHNIFYHRPETESLSLGQYTYRALVFWRENLVHKHHVLSIYTFPQSDVDTWALFDYALYTTEVDDGIPVNSTGSTTPPTDPQSPPPRPQQQRRVPTATICASCGCALLVIAGGLWYLSWRRKPRGVRSAASPPTTTPWVEDCSQIAPYPTLVPQPPRDLLGEPSGPTPDLPPEMSAAVCPERSAVATGRDNTTGLRAELEILLAENMMLRRTASPPPEYSV